MVDFEQGQLVVSAPFHKRVCFDVSNRILTAQFDGMGGVSRYAALNKWDFIQRYYNSVRLGDATVEYGAPKRVWMVGRRQITRFQTPNGDVQVTLFCNESDNAIFCEWKAFPKQRTLFRVVFNLELDYASYVKTLFQSRLSLSTLTHCASGMLASALCGSRKTLQGQGCVVIRNRFIGDGYLDYALSPGGRGLEADGLYYNQYCMQAEGEGEITLRYVMSMGSRYDRTAQDVGALYARFDEARAQADADIAAVPIPPACRDEFERAYYTNLYFTSLSMYKEWKKFRGFIAGIVYQSPARTYYRDGYWTVLPLLGTRPQLVKQEILTLARGINRDGRCPSAVKANFKNWWGDHYDSPSFFVILLYDYVRRTGDRDILSTPWRGKTLLDAAETVLRKLAEREDATGLLFKGGPYNRRDWCDNVFRMGYVTYDECLYARAYQGLGYLWQGVDDEKAARYARKARAVAQAINERLWEEEKGWYVNYASEQGVEDNLSIDTVVAVLFDIAPPDRARRMLQNMERLLESNKNRQQSAGDFGTLSVYPFYRDPAACVAKSSLPYYYHNGGDWPYLSAAYAYAKRMYDMDWRYPATRWFLYNLGQGNYTPVEFFSPYHPDGSLLQGWSSLGAILFEYPDGDFFRT